MTFSGITTSITNSAKSMNGLAQQIGTQLKTQFAPTIDKINDGIDVLKAGQDVVSTVVKDVTGQDVTIRSIQKGAADFDKKWDDFAKEINEKFNNAQSSGQADIMETFARSHFGDDVYNLGSAIKNELPDVLDGIADYKDAIDSMKSDSKTAEEAAVKIQKGVDTIVEATQKVAGSLNKAVEICTGNGLPILDDLSKIGGSAAVGNLKKVIGVGVSGATAATAFNQMKDAAKNKDFKGITDAMAKGATAVDNLLSDLGNMVPGFPKAQIPSQITASISRLQNGQSVYDAARSMVTALVVDASGPITPKTLASLTSDFNKNWDTFSDKINALFNVSPANGQTAVLETLGKSMFGPNVFNAAGAVKRQLPGVLDGVAGVQDALKQFGGSYRNPIEAVTKIRNGVEKMVLSIEKIGQSLNNMMKHYQGNGIMANGTGYPLLDTLEKLGDTKGIQALDTTLRVCGGVAAVAGNAGAVAQAIKNKDIPGAIAAVKKTVDDVQKLTKKGNYKIDDGKGSKSGLPNNSSKASDASNNGQQNSPKNKDNLSSAATDSYVCSTATMKCTMGTSQAKLTVLPTRTVFLTGKPMANISDHLTMVNLAPFGRCRSLGFPATASATAANHGSLTPMPCMHNTPFPWMGGKNDYIVKGQPALLKSSKCQCMWGGTISITNDGQTDTGMADMSKKSAEMFDVSSSLAPPLKAGSISKKIAKTIEYRKKGYSFKDSFKKASHDVKFEKSRNAEQKMEDEKAGYPGSNIHHKEISDKLVELVNALSATNDQEQVRELQFGIGQLYQERKEFELNCPVTTAAFMVRKQGYDVTARARNANKHTREMGDELNYYGAWKNLDGSDVTPTMLSEKFKEKIAEMDLSEDFSIFEEAKRYLVNLRKLRISREILYDSRYNDTEKAKELKKYLNEKYIEAFIKNPQQCEDIISEIEKEDDFYRNNYSSRRNIFGPIYKEVLIDACQEEGYYTFGLTWDKTRVSVGHYTVIKSEKDKEGNIVLTHIEPQDGKPKSDIDTLVSFLDYPPDNTDTIMRTDNKVFNPEYNDIFEIN